MADRSVDDILEDLIKNYSKEYSKLADLPKDLPATSYLNPNAQIKEVPLPENIMGFRQRGDVKNIYLNARLPTEVDPAVTLSHESHHQMVAKALGEVSPEEFGIYFDRKLVNDPSGATRDEMVRGLIKMGDYLAQRYGVQDAYFTEEEYKKRGMSLWNEQAATLSAIEEAYKTDLTKDPLLRKEVFNTETKRQGYNAISSARLTRTDKNDLAPAVAIKGSSEDMNLKEYLMGGTPLETFYNTITGLITGAFKK